MIEIETGVGVVATPTFLVQSIFDNAGTATNTGGGDVADALTGNTFDFWQMTSASGHAQMALSAPAEVNTLCIAAHDLGTQGATVTVQYDDGGYTALGAHTPADNSVIMLLMPSETAANWRVVISGAAAAPRIGVLMLGKRITLPTGIVGDYVPTNWARRVEIMGGETLSGQFLGQRIIRQSGETRIAPGLIDRTWWLANGDSLRTRYDEGRPFFFAGGPSLFPSDVAYCWRPERAEELRPAYSNAHYVAFGMDVNFYA